MALLLSSCRVWTKERLSLVLTLSEWNGPLDWLREGLLLEWAYDVHFDPSSELFFEECSGLV